MDSTCLQHTLTEEERRQFAEDGFFIVRDVLPRDLVASAHPHRRSTRCRVPAEKGAGKAPDAQLVRLYRQR